MSAIKGIPNIFPWMEKQKALRELPFYIMYGACDCCGDTMTSEGDMVIKRSESDAKVEARYCKHCKTLLDEKR